MSRYDILLLAAICATSTTAFSQGHDHDHGGPLHFSHPIVAESPSPDTKVRFDVAYFDGDEEDSTLLRLEAEYAFHPTFSIEVDVPYTFLDPEGAPSEDGLDNVEIGFKFANYAFADRGLLLGYGIEFGLPTGDSDDGIGSSNELEIEPFMDFGYKRDELEIVGFASFGIPTNQNGDEVETEMGLNLSGLYHFNDSFMGLLEFDGEGVLSGEEEGRWNVNVSPGIKVAPFANKKIELGFSAGFPLVDDDEFDTRFFGSIFYHL